jgi:hypothetical protein
MQNWLRRGPLELFLTTDKECSESRVQQAEQIMTRLWARLLATACLSALAWPCLWVSP